MSKDLHPIEEQYRSVHIAKQILDQFSECLGAFMEGELKASRSPHENPLLKDVCKHLVALEGSMSDLVIELREAQAEEDLDESASEVLAAIDSTSPF